MVSLPLRAWMPRRTFALVHCDEVRVGNVVEYDGRTCTVLAFDVHMRGRAHTTINLELKDLNNGGRIQAKLRPSDKLEMIRVEIVPMMYLYRTDDVLHLMHPSTFEQIELSIDAVSPTLLPYLEENREYKCQKHGDKFVGVQVPEKMPCVVAQTSVPLSGGGNEAYKDAILANGLRVLVPQHVKIGERVMVRTADSTYLGKAD